MTLNEIIQRRRLRASMWFLCNSIWFKEAVILNRRIRKEAKLVLTGAKYRCVFECDESPTLD